MLNEIQQANRETIDAHPEFAKVATKTGRREFMRGLGMSAAGAGAALVGMSALGQTGASAQAANMDVAILQFALNLEYLEGEFYMRAAYGQGLGIGITGPNPGMVTGGSLVPFKDPLIAAYAREIADEERKHVQFLRAALGASAIPEPAIDLVNSFITLGEAAGLGSNFDPFSNDMMFLLGAYVFEDVGVTAYHGAAKLLVNKDYLDKAAGILAVEAYHAGLIRTILFANGKSSQTQAISNVRATLDGTIGTQNLDDIGVGGLKNPSIVDCSNSFNGTLLGGFPNPPPGNNAIAFDRTTRQVLNIVYGEMNAAAGLFFPFGFNGQIIK